MESGWLIEFKNGHKIILCEENYKIYNQSNDKKNAKYESHWFILKDLVNSDSLKNLEIKQTYMKPNTYDKLFKEA